jgi:transposase
MNTTSNNYSIDLNKNILSVIEIALRFSVSKSSVYNWIKLYKSGNLTIKNEYIKVTSKFQNLDIRNIILEHIKENSNFIYSTINHTNLVRNQSAFKIYKSNV